VQKFCFGLHRAKGDNLEQNSSVIKGSGMPSFFCLRFTVRRTGKIVLISKTKMSKK
jgi:hypothetical protein